MGETLTERRRVEDDALRGVNSFRPEKRPGLVPGSMVPGEEATANSVPAAAVRQRWLALFGFIGRKGRVGGQARLV